MFILLVSVQYARGESIYRKYHRYIADVDVSVSYQHFRYIGFFNISVTWNIGNFLIFLSYFFRHFNVNLKTDSYMSKSEYLIWQCDMSLHDVTSLLVHTGLLYKLSKSMPYWFTRMVGLLLWDRRFRVHMGNDTSAWRSQRNGLPQGYVLAPVLFNLYSNDLPVTRGRKFIYADDMSRHSRPILQRIGMQSLVRYGADVTLLSTVAT